MTIKCRKKLAYMALGFDFTSRALTLLFRMQRAWQRNCAWEETVFFPLPLAFPPIFW